METSLDCIPCLVRQTIDAVRLISTDTIIHERILREALRWAADMDMGQPAPVLAQRIHRRLREILGEKDPYYEAKNHQNRIALALLSDLKTGIETAKDPLIIALRLAIAGNVIDMGVNGKVTESCVRKSVIQAMTEPFVGDYNGFCNAVAGAQRILYLTDNAGEIAFDRLLIEQLSHAWVTVAVRGAPVINDATIADDRAVELHEIVEIIDNGSDAPGTILGDCSREFKQRFTEADLIIAKGQGNFETLSDEPGDIIFLFKAKCAVVAKHAKATLGAHLLLSSRIGLANSEDFSDAGT